MKKINMNQFGIKHIRKLTFSAIFVALSFVFVTLTINIGQDMQIGITEVPLMASGFILGPIYGAIVGFVKDIIVMITQGYPISLFTVSPIILGLIPGIFMVVAGKERLYNSVPLLATAIFLATIARTINNTFALHYVMGYEWEAAIALLPLKFIVLIIEGVIYVAVFRMLLPHVNKIFGDKI